MPPVVTANLALSAEYMGEVRRQLGEEGQLRADRYRQRDCPPQTRNNGREDRTLTSEQEKYLGSWEEGT